MSVNQVNQTTGELISLAGGTRTWIGTKVAYEQQKQAGTLPNNCLIAITDDEEELAQEVIKDDPRAVTSGAVYDATHGADYIEVTADGVKTVQALLQELWALVDGDKVTANTTFQYVTSTRKVIFHLRNWNAAEWSFGSYNCKYNNTAFIIDYILVSSTGYWEELTTPNTIKDHGVDVESNGVKYRIVY